MALIVVVLSGLFGAFAALVGLVGFDISFTQALVLYLVSSVVPVALIMAGLYLRIQVARTITPDDAQTLRVRN